MALLSGRLLPALFCAFLSPLFPQSESIYDPAAGTWRLRNNRIEAQFRLNPQTNLFSFDIVRDRQTNDFWRAPANTATHPYGIDFDNGAPLSPATEFVLLGESQTALPNGVRQTIELQEASGRFVIRYDFSIYDDQPIIRYGATLRNTGFTPLTVADLRLTALDFSDEAERYEVFDVFQWVLYPRFENFNLQTTNLVPGGAPVTINTGSGATHCAWLAWRDRRQRGLLLGLEFNGRATTTLRHDGDLRALRLSTSVPDIQHALARDEEMALPHAFLGVFRGDWDEAGWRTQRFTEQVLSPRAPVDFPWVAWDSWGYNKNINEELLFENARLAAQLGMELFIVDLGWSRAIGDWRPDPVKFPRGLRPLSDYVHSLGMKFGLHYAFPEAEAHTPILEENPDWTSSRTYNYIGAESLCLGHKPVRDWIISEGVRLIRENNVDWILQDGQTIVKYCDKETHTHHPQDSNWANSEEGLDVIIAEIKRQAPQAVWEHCANGGQMMTFKMAQQYVTSITNDASGPLGSRQGVFGVTYPFSARYADRYMAETDIDEYTTRSFMFGGPWIFMNRLPEMTPEDVELAAREIRTFKTMRRTINGGKVGHLTARPDDQRTDAIQSFNPGTGAAVAVVTRDFANDDFFQLRFKDLDPAVTYRVRFETDRRTLTLTGAQLASTGVRVELPVIRSAEIVWAEPVR